MLFGIVYLRNQQALPLNIKKLEVSMNSIDHSIDAYAINALNKSPTEEIFEVKCYKDLTNYDE